MPALSGLGMLGPDHKGHPTSTPCLQAILSVRSTTAFSLTIGARMADPALASRSGSVGSPPFTPVPTDPVRGEAGCLWHLMQSSASAEGSKELRLSGAVTLSPVS
jgi:hypothetical protein